MSDTTTITGAGLVYFQPNAFSTNFAYLTITADGRLVLGEGLSADEATQATARLLLEHYNALYAEMRADRDAANERCAAAVADYNDLLASTSTAQ